MIRRVVCYGVALMCAAGCGALSGARADKTADDDTVLLCLESRRAIMVPSMARDLRPENDNPGVLRVTFTGDFAGEMLGVAPGDATITVRALCRQDIMALESPSAPCTAVMPVQVRDCRPPVPDAADSWAALFQRSEAPVELEFD